MIQIETRPLAEVRPNPRNARLHAKKQVRQIERSIQAFGFTNPLLVDEHGTLIAGHGRLEAARSLGLESVPVIVLAGLSEARKRALLLADNKIAANAGWDREKLSAELPELQDLLGLEELDVSLTGFEPAEIDALAADFEDRDDPADELPGLGDGPPVSRTGDLWQLGPHRLLCGDARDPADLERLLAGERAAVAFLDPPYNVAVSGIVGRGRIKHAEFALASGEMSQRRFTRFLREVLHQAARVSAEGAVHFVCMDWRHQPELLEAGEEVYGAMLNLVVWVKSIAGQGAFYRSQHELIAVYRVGRLAHLNNVQLGRHGRSRSNVWQYAGVNGFRAGRLEELRAHPTVKPVAMVADALKDVSRRGDLVLDTFSGSGTTVMAAERVGRRARALEIEPRFVDGAVRRWQAFTGADARQAGTGLTFEEVTAERAAERQRPGPASNPASEENDA